MNPNTLAASESITAPSEQSTVHKRLRPLYGLFAWLTLILPWAPVVRLTRRGLGVQLSAEQIIAFISAIRSVKGCRLLVFGLGNDSRLWAGANRGGETVFLENFRPWFDEITRENPDLVARPCTYHTRLADWRADLDRWEELKVDVDSATLAQRWDVILVDGPAGFAPEMPGRIAAIALARQLSAPGGTIFVHDCDREAEAAACDRILTPACLAREYPSARRHPLREYVLG